MLATMLRPPPILVWFTLVTATMVALGAESARHDEPWWSLRPLDGAATVRERPPIVTAGSLPDGRGSDKAPNPIDAFILQKLDENGMVPSVPADRRTLIRRVYFDLTGLPPT